MLSCTLLNEKMEVYSNFETNLLYDQSNQILLLNELDIFALHTEDSDYFYMHCPTIPHKMSNVVQLLKCKEKIGNPFLVYI